MKTILFGTIGTVGVPALIFFWGLLLKPKSVFAWGYRFGVAMSAFGQKKVGRRSWERVEKKCQGTLSDFISGITAGLDSDD